jgi:hypothetical protein
LLIGLAVAFLLERLDRRIREPKDLEAVYGLPLLGVVPESAALARSARRGGKPQAALPPNEAEVFHLIRAHLRYFNVDRELRTLMVASAAPGDGKTTVAQHLAGAAARMGSRVLLIEVDLRRPTLAKQLNIPAGPGLADVLIGAEAMSDAIQSIPLDPPASDGRNRRDVAERLHETLTGAGAPCLGSSPTAARRAGEAPTPTPATAMRQWLQQAPHRTTMPFAGFPNGTETSLRTGVPSE